MRPQETDAVLDKLDMRNVISHRLFRESCFSHKGNYVKVKCGWRHSILTDEMGI